VGGLGDGGVVLLENLRFNAGETSKDEAERTAFARALAAYGDTYVDDAFGAVHRKHASVYDVPKLLPHYGGWLVVRELDVLRRLTENPDRPYVVVLGGAKVSDKLAVIESLLPKVDRLLIGGGMCFTFLKAQGHEPGTSLLEAEMVDTCADLLARAAGKIVLPVDIVAASGFSADADHDVVAADAIPADRMGLDIGPATVTAFREALAGPVPCSGTVRWACSSSLRSRRGPAAWPRRSRPSTASRSSAVATRRRRCGPWASPRTRSGTSQPAAGRRWNTSRARPSPACRRWSPSWQTSHAGR
jgi:3-phosphoglycerate kinase